jgi:hypothetical protein
MPLNRREILQLFGVGAAVVPIIGGAPEMAATARLVEVPRVEPCISTNPYPQVKQIRMETGGRYRMTLTALHDSFLIEGDTFLTDLSYESLKVTDFSGRAVDTILSQQRLRWTLSGEFLEDQRGQLANLVFPT